MKSHLLVVLVALMLLSCHKSSSPVPNPADAIVGTYVGYYHYNYSFDSFTFDTSYIANAYITAVDTDSVHIICSALGLNYTSYFYRSSPRSNTYYLGPWNETIVNDTLSAFFYTIFHDTGNFANTSWSYRAVKQR